MNFYEINIYWEDGEGIKKEFYFHNKDNAISFGEEWIKNNFFSEGYHLSDSYESLEECLTAWRENREIEWVINFYPVNIKFED